MDMQLNRIPARVKTIHLIAVCGTGMGALAVMLKEMGFEVTGSDGKTYPPMSTFLADKGIGVNDGFNPQNLAHRPDLVVVGNAVTRQNPEALKLAEMKLPFCSMPQAVNHFAAEGKRQIVVTGTHGKTTTAAIIAWILEVAGLDPTFIIGGILKNFSSNFRLTAGTPIVLEGDEYDTAFFDKGPKFLHYSPDLSVLTSLEFDHADIYYDLAHVQQAFDRYIGRIPPGGALLAFDGSPHIAPLLSGRACRIDAYGRDAGSAWRLGSIAFDPPWTRFETFKTGVAFGQFRTQLMGEHNLLNALAATAIADQFGIAPHIIDEGLTTFQGVKRRQEVRGVKNGVTVMDDFAHHPTAVRETLRAVKPFYPHGRLIAVFEPRTHSSMRNIFQGVYPQAFGPADIVCIRKPSQLEKIPAGIRFSSEQLVEDLRRRGQRAYYFTDTEAIVAFLSLQTRPGDLVLVMSNGGFDNIHQRLLD